MNAAAARADVLRLLGMEGTEDGNLVARVDTIISGVGKALSLRIGGVEVPDALDYIVRDVSVARYNRIGSEGASSHTVEGETVSYVADDFAPYAADIAEWVRQNQMKNTRTVRFL